MPTERRSRYWTDEDRALLRAMYPTAPISEIVERLGRSSGAVHGMASTLGIRRDTPESRAIAARSWTDEDRELLRAMFPSDPIPTIARRLGRTQGAIWSQAAALKLSRATRRSHD